MNENTPLQTATLTASLLNGQQFSYAITGGTVKDAVRAANARALAITRDGLSVTDEASLASAFYPSAQIASVFVTPVVEAGA